MTEPKTVKAKEAGELSETTKTFVEEMWLEREWRYSEPVMTDEMMKGLLNEQDSLQLVQHNLKGEFRIKNTTSFKNEFICGTPDIILKNEDCVEDVKTSWGLKTFFHAELEKNYYWQGIGYMALTGKKHYRLIYCLTNTPNELVEAQKINIYYKFGCDEENPHYQKMSEQIMQNHNFDHVPIEKKIKVFAFDFSESDYELLKNRIIKAREYYNGLHL